MLFDWNDSPSRARRAKQVRSLRQLILQVEKLEDRSLMAIMHPSFMLQHPISSSITPDTTASPSGLSPTTMRHAYGVDAVSFSGVTGDGSGQVIAIVDAYDEPTIATDLAAFSTRFGLPAATLLKRNQFGGTAPPAADVKGGWGVETALDVEWAHAIAPKATILLVEADSDNDSDLYAAVDYARSFAGVSAVSMSWGADEASSDAASDFHFTTPAGHGGVAFLSSSGDNGAYSDNSASTKIVGYPAASRNVVAIGGTRLNTGAGGAYSSESGWGSGTSSFNNGGSGGGISKFFSQPSYQQGVVTQSTSKRTLPDVSLDADPNSGASIYDAYDNGSSKPWDVVGGTSLASPMWAGIVAIADQGRALNGLSSLDGATELLPKLYSLPSTDFHDITSGNNGYAAGSGYDLVTGRGTPIVNLLVQDLAGTVQTGVPTISSFTTNPTSVTVGGSTTLTATATESGGTIGSVVFYRESNSISGLQNNSDTFIGSGTQNGSSWTLSTPTTGLAAGTYTYYAIATDSANVSSSAASSMLTITSQQSSGVLLGFSVTGQTNFGVQGLRPIQIGSGVTNNPGLARAVGVSTIGTAASNAWGGTNWASTYAAGIGGNQFVAFGLKVNAGETASLSAIDLNYRHSGSGPTNGLWQYSLNGTGYKTIGVFLDEFSTSSSSGAAMTEVNLSGIAGLQNLAAGTTVKIRLVPYGASGSGGTWYVYDLAGQDLVLKGATQSSSSPLHPAFTTNSAAIAAAIAKTPQTAGPISSVSVVNFGTTVYTGPLNVANTINRVRANGKSLDADDGIVYNNSNGKLPNKGTWYEFVVHPQTGSDHNFSNVDFPGPMRLILNTDGTVYFTGDHYSSFKLVSNPATATPTIGSFTLSPTSITSGGSTTLTASNVVETGGTISNVKFYRETNGTSGLQIGADTLVGTGSVNGSTWTLATTTTGYAAGSYTYYAVATDAASKTSAAASAILTVTAATTTPTIGSFTLSPNSVTVGGSTTVTANNVTESGGTISSVGFYRESNGTAGLQLGSDTLVGSGANSGGTSWSLSASTTGLAAGNYTYYAVAADTAGKTSAAASAMLTVTSSVPSGVLLGWNMTGQTNFGTQGLRPILIGGGVTNNPGLARAVGVSTTGGTAASDAWGGTNWAATSAAGISGNQFIAFGLKVSAGQTASLSAIDLNYRHSGSGPTSGLWQYSLNGTGYKTIGDFANEFPSSSSSGAAMTEINLSGIAGLQNLPAGTMVKIRLVPYGGSGSGGTWYVYDLTGNDLVVKGTVAAAAPMELSQATVDLFWAQYGASETTKRNR